MLPIHNAREGLFKIIVSFGLIEDVEEDPLILLIPLLMLLLELSGESCDKTGAFISG
jgi:hypothetical protein